jgi:hypothetical protein
MCCLVFLFLPGFQDNQNNDPVKPTEHEHDDAAIGQPDNISSSGANESSA